MNERQLKALKGSIEKWTRIVIGTGLDEGQRNCDCCQEFIDTFPVSCDGCPIREHTGIGGCQRTPYVDWQDYVSQNCFAPFGIFDDESRRLAQAELDFLKSLLPQEVKETA